jgi:hypothetical protein
MQLIPVLEYLENEAQAHERTKDSLAACCTNSFMNATRRSIKSRIAHEMEQASFSSETSYVDVDKLVFFFGGAAFFF